MTSESLTFTFRGDLTVTYNPKEGFAWQKVFLAQIVQELEKMGYSEARRLTVEKLSKTANAFHHRIRFFNRGGIQLPLVGYIPDAKTKKFEFPAGPEERSRLLVNERGRPGFDPYRRPRLCR